MNKFDNWFFFFFFLTSTTGKLSLILYNGTDFLEGLLYLSPTRQGSMANSPTSNKLIAIACIALSFFFFFSHPFQSEICSGIGANRHASVRSAAAVCDTHCTTSVAELCGASDKSVSLGVALATLFCVPADSFHCKQYNCRKEENKKETSRLIWVIWGEKKNPDSRVFKLTLLQICVPSLSRGKHRGFNNNTWQA